MADPDDAPAEDGQPAGYCSGTDVRAMLTAATETPTPGDVASLGETAMNVAIQDAQNEIDAALGARYDVPFAQPVPALVRSLAASIAAYLATLTFYGSVDLPNTEPSVLRYQRARKMLDDLASGKAVVPLDPDGPGPEEPTQQPRRSRGVHNAYSGHLFGPEDFALGPVPPRRW